MVSLQPKFSAPHNFLVSLSGARLTRTLGCGLVLAVATIGRTNAQTVLNGFETASDIAQGKGSNATLSGASDYVTQGSQSLQITFKAADLPYVEFKPTTPWNMSQCGGLAIDFANPDAASLVVGVRVEDASGKYRTSDVSLAPFQTGKYRFPYPAASDPNGLKLYGMRGLPEPFPGISRVTAYGSTDCDLTKIVRLVIFTRKPAAAHSIRMDNLRLLPAFDMNSLLAGTVDAFGQDVKVEWPGKVHNLSELTARRFQETTALVDEPTLTYRDRFGGWTGEPNFGAASFFRTAKLNGKWWLVTPDGHPFLTMGVSSVEMLNYGQTMLDGRYPMFTSLPGYGDPLRVHVGYCKQVYSGPVREGYTYNFTAANAHRKYGETWDTDWLNMAVSRLQAWGFNTLGAWSDNRLYASQKMPYTICGGTTGGNYATIYPGGSGWYLLPDVFDPKFADFIATKFASFTTKSKNDPWCLGYFVDNEMSWAGSGTYANYGLALGTLAKDADDSPAKRAFVSQLKLCYGRVKALNQAWGTTFTNWNDLNAPYTAPKVLPNVMVDDLASFCTAFARRYFRLVHDELKRKDPNHLYLGCRFLSYTPEVVKAASEYADVVSFNIYRTSVDPQQWAFLNTLNKPCMVSEWHVGALDRGMFHPGIVSAVSQAERAATFTNYVHSIVDNPMMVGCHWFQYADQPLTGRCFDGENYNIGFVDVTDTPYPEMVQAAKSALSESYGRRYYSP